jgi:hypothetical protein
MNRPSRPFDPSELDWPDDADVSAADRVRVAAVARDLETLATDPLVQPPSDFADRVMTAVALEAAPRLVVRPGGSARGGPVGAFLLTIRDAWAVASGSGRPWAIRGQALAFVLLVVLTAGALTGLTAVTVGGLLAQDLSPRPTLEAPSIKPSPTFLPTPSPTFQPTPSPTPTPTRAPSDTPRSDESAGPKASDEGPEGGDVSRARPTGGAPGSTPTETPATADDGSPESGHEDDGIGAR